MTGTCISMSYTSMLEAAMNQLKLKLEQQQQLRL
jgi:hypothetical protein